MADHNNSSLVSANITVSESLTLPPQELTLTVQDNTVKDFLVSENAFLVNSERCNNSNRGSQEINPLLAKCCGCECTSNHNNVSEVVSATDTSNAELKNSSEAGVKSKASSLCFDIDVSDCTAKSKTGPSNLQEAFIQFRRRRQEDLKQERRAQQARSRTNASPCRMEELRCKLTSQAKKYFGVPYAKKYWAPDTPEYMSPIFLDCCGLVRRVMRDLQADLGFRLGPWNQCYMFDTLPVTLTKEQMKPGDLVFMTGVYVNPKSKKQPHDMVHVEIWLGEGDKTIGSRWNNGKVQIFDSYKFSPKSFHSEQYIFKSIDTWLMGICHSHCPQHPWRLMKYNPNTKSIFSIQETIPDENADLGYDDDDEESQSKGHNHTKRDKSPNRNQALKASNNTRGDISPNGDQVQETSKTVPDEKVEVGELTPGLASRNTVFVKSTLSVDAVRQIASTSKRCKFTLMSTFAAPSRKVRTCRRTASITGDTSLVYDQLLQDISRLVLWEQIVCKKTHLLCPVKMIATGLKTKDWVSMLSDKSYDLERAACQDCGGKVDILIESHVAELLNVLKEKTCDKENFPIKLQSVEMAQSCGKTLQKISEKNQWPHFQNSIQENQKESSSSNFQHLSALQAVRSSDFLTSKVYPWPDLGNYVVVILLEKNKRRKLTVRVDTKSLYTCFYKAFMRRAISNCLAYKNSNVSATLGYIRRKSKSPIDPVHQCMTVSTRNNSIQFIRTSEELCDHALNNRVSKEQVSFITDIEGTLTVDLTAGSSQPQEAFFISDEKSSSSLHMTSPQPEPGDHLQENISNNINEHNVLHDTLGKESAFSVIDAGSKDTKLDKDLNGLSVRRLSQDIMSSLSLNCIQDNLIYITSLSLAFCIGLDEFSVKIQRHPHLVKSHSGTFVSEKRLKNVISRMDRYGFSVLRRSFWENYPYSSDLFDDQEFDFKPAQGWQFLLSTGDDAAGNTNNSSSCQTDVADFLRVDGDETCQDTFQSELQHDSILPPVNPHTRRVAVTPEAKNMVGVQTENSLLNSLSWLRKTLKFNENDFIEVPDLCAEQNLIEVACQSLVRSDGHEVAHKKNPEQSGKALLDLELAGKGADDSGKHGGKIVLNQLPQCADGADSDAHIFEKCLKYPKCDAWQVVTDSSNDQSSDVSEDITGAAEGKKLDEDCKTDDIGDLSKSNAVFDQTRNKFHRGRFLRPFNTPCSVDNLDEITKGSTGHSRSFWIPLEQTDHVPQNTTIDDSEDDEEDYGQGTEFYDPEKQTAKMMIQSLFRTREGEGFGMLSKSRKVIPDMLCDHARMRSSMFSGGGAPSQRLAVSASADGNNAEGSEQRQGQIEEDCKDISQVSSPTDGGGDDNRDKDGGGAGGKKGARQSRLPQCCLPNNMQPTFFIGGGNGIALIEGPLLALGWKRTSDRYDERYKLKWVENKSGINYLTFREGEQLVNHIPNCKLLTNKLGLLCSLQEYERVTLLTKGRLPRLKMADFVPETYKLDDRIDREKFLHEYQDGETWICKPTGMNQGKGIFLLRSREKINQLLYEREAKLNPRAASRVPMMRIVQRYISHPLLLEGRKFDIRSYMFIACTVPFLVLYHKGYVRLSCQKYSEEDSNLTTHLTNQFVQKKDPAYKDVKEDTAWTMDKLNDYINENYAKEKGLEIDWVYRTLTKQMQRITLHCFNSVKHKLQCKMGYFDLYGMDFMVDSNMKVWLIEINANPALHTNCQALKEAIPSVVEDALHLAIECFDKSRKGQPLMPLNSLGGYTVLYCGSSPNTVTHRQIRSVSPFKDITDWSRPSGTAVSVRRHSPSRNLPRMNLSQPGNSQSSSSSQVSSTKSEKKLFVSSTLPTINIGMSVGLKPVTVSGVPSFDKHQQLSSQSHQQQQQHPVKRIYMPPTENNLYFSYMESAVLKSRDNSHRGS